MAEVKFKMDPQGARQLMRSPAALAMVSSVAGRVAQAAEAFGGSYVVKPQTQPTRASALVATEGFEARKANGRHNALLKALGGGRQA